MIVSCRAHRAPKSCESPRHATARQHLPYPLLSLQHDTCPTFPIATTLSFPIATTRNTCPILPYRYSSTHVFLPQSSTHLDLLRVLESRRAHSLAASAQQVDEVGVVDRREHLQVPTLQLRCHAKGATANQNEREGWSRESDRSSSSCDPYAHCHIGKSCSRDKVLAVASPRVWRPRSCPRAAPGSPVSAGRRSRCSPATTNPPIPFILQ